MIRRLVRHILEEQFSVLLNEVGEFNYNKSYTPPAEVVSACKKAISDYGSDMQIAVSLAAGKPQTYEQVKNIRDFFSKNAQNKQDPNVLKNWNLYGGDAAYKWVQSSLEKLHDQNMSTKDNLRKAGGAGNKKGMGIFDTSIMDTTKGRNKIR